MHAALSPAPAHTGFDKIVVGKEALIDTESYAHYLHHKYFECNYADESSRWISGLELSTTDHWKLRNE